MSLPGLISWSLYLPLTIIAIALASDASQAALGASWTVAYLVGINLAAFMIYVWDKVIAGPLESWGLSFLPLRVPEALLIWGLAFPGGTLGAILAMFLANHKTAKPEFGAKLLIALALQFVLVVLILLAVFEWGRLSLAWLDEVAQGVVGLGLDLADILLRLL